MKSKIYKNLPTHIKGFLVISQGWLVGGAIEDLIKDQAPRDYDVIIPDRHTFQSICKAYESFDLKLNSFGGMKINLEGSKIDFWCEELSHFLITANEISYVFNMRKNLLLKSL